MTAAGVDVVARGASVRGRRGPVFEGVDLDVPHGRAAGRSRPGRFRAYLASAGARRADAAVRRGGPGRRARPARRGWAGTQDGRRRPGRARGRSRRAAAGARGDGRTLPDQPWRDRARHPRGLRDLGHRPTRDRPGRGPRPGKPAAAGDRAGPRRTAGRPRRRRRRRGPAARRAGTRVAGPATGQGPRPHRAGRSCLHPPPPPTLGLVALLLPRRSQDRLPAGTATVRKDADT